MKDLALYSNEEIENVKHSLSFPREYEGKYIGLEGNVFTPQTMLRNTKLDKSGSTSQHTDVFDALRLAVQVYNKEE